MSHRIPLLGIATLFVVAGFLMPPGLSGALLLILAQLAILGSCIVERRVTAVGSFIFMYVLFFAFRPLFFFTERDWELMTRLFRLPPDMSLPYNALCWAGLCLICFRIGSLLPTANQPPALLRTYLKAERKSVYLLDRRDILPLLLLQLITLLALQWVVGRSGGLYGFGTSYIYDMPVPIQAVHAFSVIFILQMHRMDRRNLPLKWALAASVLLFVAFTITMRTVSIFRLFYLTGFLVVCFAYLASRQRRVGYAWLILPIIIALPLFDVLGRVRYESNDAVGTRLRREIDDLLTPRNYWLFFEGQRDMNIFDSYTAALEWQPKDKPYFKQWLYPAVHWIPRKVWKSKPPGGMQIDLAGPMRGAPYSPGINGIFYLGGGYLYMLASMVLLGYCIAKVHATIAGMKDGVLKWTYYGTFVVNAMLLTRFFLFQFVWQVMYVAVPCFGLNYLLIRKLRIRRKRKLAEPAPTPVLRIANDHD